jgi:hypothetical protein
MSIKVGAVIVAAGMRLQPTVRAGQNPAVTGYDSARGVNQHGVCEAKFPDTAGDFCDLSLRMGSRVARMRDQSADFPPFDSDLSGAAGVAGVEVPAGTANSP